MPDCAALQRLADCEIQARQAVEALLEQTRRELESAHVELRTVRADMDARVAKRTKRLLSENEQLQEQMVNRDEHSRRLIAMSHEAGKSEVAAGVLHSIGNVLNSVSVSAELCANYLRNNHSSTLSKATELLETNSQNIVTFLTIDAKGEKLPILLRQLSVAIESQRAELLKEFELLRENVSTIKGMVQSQEASARVNGITERFSLIDVVEEAIKVNEVAILRHGIQVERHFPDELELVTGRQQVLQVMIHLLSNAKSAIANSLDPRIVIRLSEWEGGMVHVQVQDNGVGMSEERLSSLFAGGFSTQNGNHGFGLHHCALAAKQLGGRLTAQSDGPDSGAMFSLIIPQEIKRIQHG